MKLITRLLVTAAIVMIIPYLLSGVTVDGLLTSIKIAVVLSLLNTFIKPILVFFTFPITLLTLGLFLLIINAIIILLCDHFLNGFKIDTFFTALLFSIILSICQSIAYKFTDDKK